MRPGSSASDTWLTAVTPPNRLTTRSSSRRGGTVDGGMGGPLDRPRQAVLLLEHPEDAARHQQHDADYDGAEQELVEVDELGPHELLQDEEQRRAEHRPPDRALAAEQHHHDHRDRGDEREHADRLDVALVARGQAARDPGADRGE